MRNLWLVAKHEYRGTVVRRGFLIMTIAIPLGMAALIALGILVESMGADNRPIGYVDYSGTLDPGLLASLPDDNGHTQILSFADEELAITALEGEEIQALFVLPAEYPQTLHSDLYYLEDPPGGDAWGDFDDFVRVNLLSDMPEEMQELLLEGPDIAVYDLASNREFSEASIINVVMPFVVTFFFIFATMSGAGYMLGVVAGEKENRTVEVMVTSVTPVQLIGGKAAGLLAASLTQLAIYVVAAVVGLIVAAQYVPEIQQLEVPWLYLGIMALFFLPTYALISAVMIAVGAAVTDLQQGQQFAGLLNLFFMLAVAGGPDSLASFTAEQRDALVLLFAGAHGTGYLIGLVFFGVYCLILGRLVMRASFFPQILGILLILAGVGYLVDSFAQFLYPGYQDHAAVFQMVVFLPAFSGEMAFALYLVVRGVRNPAPL